MSENNTSVDSWDGILNNFLKAEHVPEGKEEIRVPCYNVKVNGSDMDLFVEFNEKKYIFSLNITNKVFIKNNGITVPKEIIGKMITLKKSMAMNPNLKKEVPTLRISKVE